MIDTTSTVAFGSSSGHGPLVHHAAGRLMRVELVEQDVYLAGCQLGRHFGQPQYGRAIGARMAVSRHEQRHAAARGHHRLAVAHALLGNLHAFGIRLARADEAHAHRMPAKPKHLAQRLRPLFIGGGRFLVDEFRARMVVFGGHRVGVHLHLDGVLRTVSRARLAAPTPFGVHGLRAVVHHVDLGRAEPLAQAALDARVAVDGDAV